MHRAYILTTCCRNLNGTSSTSGTVHGCRSCNPSSCSIVYAQSSLVLRAACSCCVRSKRDACCSPPPSPSCSACSSSSGSPPTPLLAASSCCLCASRSLPSSRCFAAPPLLRVARSGGRQTRPARSASLLHAVPPLLVCPYTPTLPSEPLGGGSPSGLPPADGGAPLHHHHHHHQIQYSYGR